MGAAGSAVIAGVRKLTAKASDAGVVSAVRKLTAKASGTTVVSAVRKLPGLRPRRPGSKNRPPAA